MESDSAPYMDMVPRETIPLLRSYDGPVYFGLLLTPGRPVESIELSSLTGSIIKDPFEIFACAAKVTVPLRRLSISGTVKPNLQLFSVIDSFFPSLEYLSITVDDSNPDATASDDDSDDNESPDDSSLSDSIEYPECITPETDDELFTDDVQQPSDSTGWKTDAHSTPISSPSLSTTQLMSDNSDDSQGDVSDDEGSGLAEIELNDKGFPSRSPDSFAGIMDWLALNRLPLPPRLANLRIRGAKCSPGMAEQRRAIEMLPISCPHLREVWFGSTEVVWRRQLPSRLWKTEPMYQWDRQSRTIRSG